MISVGSSSSFPEQTTIALKTIRVLAFSQVFRRPIKRNSHRADPTNGVITRNNYYSVLYAKNDGVYCNMIFALRIFRKSRDWRNAVKAGIREKLKKKKKKKQYRSREDAVFRPAVYGTENCLDFGKFLRKKWKENRAAIKKNSVKYTGSDDKSVRSENRSERTRGKQVSL